MAQEESKFNVINILDLIDMEEVGEESVKTWFADFSCAVNDEITNQEVENFLRNRAIEFSKKRMAITHLVFNNQAELVGIFTLALKTMSIKAEGLSGTLKRKLDRYAKCDEDGEYTLPAYLVAQFSKNHIALRGESITGTELMGIALAQLKDIQRQTGGGVVMLECTEAPRLLEFYKNSENNFQEFGERYSDTENVKYIQLFRMI